MKINKYVEDLKAKTSAELNEELVAAKKELFNLRFQNATNQLDNTSRIKEVRRNIASYKQEIETLKNRLQQKEERFSEQKEKMLSKAREEAQKILQDAC